MALSNQEGNAERLFPPKRFQDYQDYIDWRDRSNSVDDDSELIQRYLRGDKMAGALLVARHGSALFCWLRWKTGSREDAEDLTQLVWCKAFPALERLEDRAAFRAWLFAIMRREFTHWLRDHRPTSSLEAGDATLDSPTFCAVRGTLDGIEDRLALQNALAQLSEDHRDTFMLRYLSQFSAPEVAQILEIPVGTVESRCHFARARLKELLRQDEEVPGTPQRAVPSPSCAVNAAAPKPADRKPWFKGHFR